MLSKSTSEPWQGCIKCTYCEVDFTLDDDNDDNDENDDDLALVVE